MKSIYTLSNGVGGLDLIVDKDAGNPVRISTGRTAKSVEFWERLIYTAKEALNEIEARRNKG